MFQAGHFCLGHSPVIDGVNGEGGFLPKHPLDIRAEGNHNQVPIFGGFNAEDGSLYVLACMKRLTYLAKLAEEVFHVCYYGF